MFSHYFFKYCIWSFFIYLYFSGSITTLLLLLLLPKFVRFLFIFSTLPFLTAFYNWSFSSKIYSLALSYFHLANMCILHSTYYNFFITSMPSKWLLSSIINNSMDIVFRNSWLLCCVNSGLSNQKKIWFIRYRIDKVLSFLSYSGCAPLCLVILFVIIFPLTSSVILSSFIDSSRPKT